MVNKDGIKVIARAKMPSEYQVQSSFVEYVRHKYPHLSKSLIHIPNEGKRSLREGARQKALGLTRGVSDLLLAVPMQFYLTLEDGTGATPIWRHGLWIEMKSGKGKLTKEQEEFLDLMATNGYRTAVARSFEEAVKIFEDYVG